MSAIELYYDFSCPWSYLALVRLQDVADRNATRLELKPVDVNAVLATENPALQASRLAENPAKAAWQRRDLEHWAKFWGLRIELGADWPQPAGRAAAAACAADRLGSGFQYAMDLFAASFAAGRDLTDDAVLTELAVTAGLDADKFAAELARSETGQQIADWTEELVRRGGFGTPCVFVGDELFFGNDRIPLVDWFVGPISEEDFVMPGQHA